MPIYNCLKVEPKQGNTGAFEVLTFQDPNSGQTFTASLWSPPGPVGFAVVNRQVQVELQQKGKYTNVTSIALADASISPPLPAMAPQQPQQLQPVPAQPQLPPTLGTGVPNMNTALPGMGALPGSMPVPATPAPLTPTGQQVAKKDLMMAKMSAMRAAAEQVAGLIGVMANQGDAPTHEQIKEITNGYAEDYLAWILSD